MSSATDPMGAPSSFAARRSAASNLPAFELPPPSLSAIQQKFPSFTTVNVPQPSPVNANVNSVGNLLTPPSQAPGDALSPVSSGLHSGSSGSTQGLPAYSPGAIWAAASQGAAAPYTLGSTPTYGTPNVMNPLLPPRGMFSPSFNSLTRNNTNSPSAADALPPPPYELSLPPFPTSASMSAPGALPALAVQQQAMALLSAQAPTSTAGSQPSPIPASDPYHAQRQPPTPSYYGGSQSSSTPHQSQYAGFSAPSPSQQNPLNARHPSSRLSPPGVTQAPMLQAAANPQLNHYPRALSAYSLPAMPGPVMSNMHSPGGQMALIGSMANGLLTGYHGPHAAGISQLYGAHAQPPPQPSNDRPFRCDQCPQSFNRNHDLKRHKRIHLAVKPFPCGHCEKSFSRKDALKVSLNRETGIVVQKFGMLISK
ncbi:hypothetical protein L228DRAFT_249767 [Xylona heveae TC161]|uniref:C2H2-type domain-containing protein n=1 Tax=Xylona heveae (strain CBS 132557 / TC161) TaxID=1328760 RepID=A0A165FFY3_XYLHT|nr:hypothetical protein L228DRAFT_249767 [Xylona heveae TC161]KZF20930.1 hypothetical protein L228DRAFT_249767 [Xylona heveae TC161]